MASTFSQKRRVKISSEQNAALNLSSAFSLHSAKRVVDVHDEGEHKMPCKQ